MKNLGLGSLAALILALGSGYLKSAPAGGRQPSRTINPTPQQSTLARVHWLGKKQIAARKSSSYFMSIWNLPEAARLESQTLDKLALALIGQPPGGASNQLSVTSNPSSGTNRPSTINPQLSTKLRPLLDDLVREEWYLEIQQAPNQPGELALAVRLDDQRAELWTSNLTAVLGAMTNAQSLPAPASRLAWRLPLASSAPPVLTWLAPATGPCSACPAETNGLLAELIHRVRAEHTPVGAPGTDSSLRRDPITRKVRPFPPTRRRPMTGSTRTLTCGGCPARCRWAGTCRRPGRGLPRPGPARANTSGPAGKLTFAQPLNLPLEPWNIPTNLIRDPLVSFSAVRGVGPWLAGQELVPAVPDPSGAQPVLRLGFGAAPLPTFAAAPMTNAAALLQTIGPRIAGRIEPLDHQQCVRQCWSSRRNRRAWFGQEYPCSRPAVEAVATPGGTFLLGRLGAKAARSQQARPARIVRPVDGTAQPGLLRLGNHPAKAQPLDLPGPNRPAGACAAANAARERRLCFPARRPRPSWAIRAPRSSRTDPPA